jgi:hypothetical protein
MPAFVDDALRQRGLVEALPRARPTGARTT